MLVPFGFLGITSGHHFILIQEGRLRLMKEKRSPNFPTYKIENESEQTKIIN